MLVKFQMIVIFVLSMIPFNATTKQSHLNISSESLRFFPSLDRNIDTQMSSCVVFMESYKNTSLTDIDGEVWRQSWVCHDYLVSNLGRVKTFNHRGHGREAILKLTITKHGFIRVNLWVNKKCVGYAVHDLVAMEFVPNPTKALSAFHKNGIVDDNRSENLLWEIPKLEGEEWKDIEGWESIYMVSSEGRIKSLSRHRKNLKGSIAVKSECILRQTGKREYLTISLKFNGKIDAPLVHRLVAYAFVPNPDNKPCVNHKNGVKKDNRAENLEWCTYPENTHHALRAGLMDARGEKSYSHKLTHSQVLEIFNSDLPTSELMKIYPVKQNAIRKIKEGKSWYSVTKMPNKNAGYYPS